MKVIDGDTLDLDIDLGFSVHIRERVRLKGLDTPEMKTDEGKAVRAWVVEWFVRDGGLVLVDTFRDKRDKYGRMLAVIHDSKGSLNEDLLDTGRARPYDGGAR